MSLNEPKHTAEFLLSEANGTLSREQAVLGGSEVSYEPGTVLAFDGDEIVALSVIADDPETTESEVAQSVAGVLLAAGVSGDKAAYIARKAEVKGSALVFPASSALTADDIAEQLATLGIIVR